METNLYQKDVSGSIRLWNIKLVDNKIIIKHGILNGVMVTSIEDIYEGKGGRSVKQQALSRYQSRINKQKLKGYCESVGEAEENARCNSLKLPKPMLAQTLEKVKGINFKKAFVQRKYDGNRCLIAGTEDGPIAYSRNGKRIETIGHILEGLNLAPGVILDGELYCHGEPLQTLVSWIKREQTNTKRLKYHLYDTVCELPFHQRYDLLKQYHTATIEPVETFPVVDLGEAMSLFRDFRKGGYEGAILRWGDLGYEDGKRSKTLVKIKEWHDEEFLVVDVHASKDGWGICECITAEGGIFRVTAPGPIDAKEQVLNAAVEYIGRMLTVEYAYKTKDGVPFHPVAKCWR